MDERLQRELHGVSNGAAFKSYTRDLELPSLHEHGGRTASLKKQTGGVSPKQDGLWSLEKFSIQRAFPSSCH